MENEFIAEHRRAFPHVNLSIYQQEMIEYGVHDLEAWKETIRFWAGNDYRGQSIFKMIDYYNGIINGKPQTNSKSNVVTLQRSADYFERKYGNDRR